MEVYKSFIKDAAVSISVQTFHIFYVALLRFSCVVGLRRKGQSPFAHYKTLHYMKDVDNAWCCHRGFRYRCWFNLCKTRSALDLAMRIGLTNRFMDLVPSLNTLPGARKPTCTWSTFQSEVLSADNWQSQSVVLMT